MKRFCALLIMMVCMMQYANCQEKFLTAGKIDRELSEEINNSSRSDDLFRVIIVMSEQYDAVKMTRQTQFMDKMSKREFVINEMKRFTGSSQFEVVNFLNTIKADNSVKNVQQYWAFNGISCEASADVIALLAERSDIKMICSDKERNMLPEEWDPQPVSPTRENAWNITKVNADDVWVYSGEFGFTGNGVLVAVIDSGVNYNHADIVDNMWNGGSDYPHHGYDFVNDDFDPIDDHGHGSHCAGTIAGYGTSGIQTGIAPNAKIMALKTMADDGYGLASHSISAIEFALEHGADVINMSLGMAGDGGHSYFRDIMVTVKNAGVVASVAAGNVGNQQSKYPIPYNINSPGNCPPPWLNPDQAAILPGGTSAVVCIGATDQSDKKAVFSSIGPATWTQGSEIGSYNDYPYTEGDATEIGLIRPDVAAPGVAIPSLNYYNNNSYVTMNGSSMATPCVAGIMALMLEVDNTLTPAEIDEILETTAVFCEGQITKNNLTGSGRVNALAAIDKILGIVPPSDFTATVVNNDVQMSWSAVSEATSYKVYRDDVEIATVSTTSYTDTSLSDGVYLYSVSAVYPERESCPTNSVEAQVGDVCIIVFDLFDGYGDGWTGAFVTASFSDGTPSINYTIESGISAQYTCIVSTGTTVSLEWTSGEYDIECYFTVEYRDGSVIYTGGNLVAGFLDSFEVCPGEYMVNIENGIEHGTITARESAAEGVEVMVTATPDTDYRLAYLYYYTTDPNEKTYIDTGTKRFVMPGADVTIGATFIDATISTHTITVAVDPAEGGIVNGGGTYEQGETATVSVQLNDNYEFEGWMENEEVVSTDLEYSFTVTSDRDLVAKVSYYDDINEVNNISTSIYPNPIDDILSITCSESIINISLFTIAGNEVFTKTNIVEKSFVADVSDLTAGTYILRIETNQGMVYRKISKR